MEIRVIFLKEAGVERQGAGGWKMFEDLDLSKFLVALKS
jgi:hypothetical protein